jgi:hypothetical protein
MDESDSWGSFTSRLERLGRRLIGDDFPSDPVGRTEAFDHLASQVLCWLSWGAGHADPSRPTFQRQNDLVTAWGGPNADNVYRHARIDPQYSYVIRGRMHACEEFVLAVREGFRHSDHPATLAELTASDIGIGPGDEFELLLGGDGSEPNRIPLPEGAIMCSIREYYFDWTPQEPATWTIERTGGSVAVVPPFADRLDEAIDLTERSLVYWNDYMRLARDRQEENTFGAKVDVPRGLQISQFLFCFCDLGPDEALVVECDRPDARYWSFQHYGLHFFRPLDISRQTSLNHRQMHEDADGKIRLVVSHSDPGVRNWMDTQGRRNVLLNYRHFWGSPLPNPRTRIVPADSVHDVLPSATPTIGSEERATALVRRAESLAWRFRT